MPRFHPLGRALAAALAGPCLPALAADAERPLDTVTVTAKGYTSAGIETPVSVDAVERKQWLDRGAQNLGEALRGLPGLAVASDGAQGQNPVIRGLKKEGIVLLVDGMRLNSAQPAGAIASFMSLGLADRIELVRGPASVLYGTGALGGAINVLLPQARFEPGVQARLSAQVDSASEGLRAATVVNASGGDHALMLGVSAARIGDYRAPDGEVERTGYDSDSAIGQYRLRLDAAQQLRVSLQQHTDSDVWYPGSTRPHPHPQVRSATMHSPEQTRRLAEIGYSRKGSGDHPVNTDVRIYRQEMERQIFARANGPLGRDVSQARVSFETDGLDARADWLAHPDHLLSLGVNAWRMAASPERLISGPPAFAPVLNDPFADGRIEAVGVYLQDDMRLGRLNILAGLRRDRVEGSAASMGNGAVTTGLERSDSATSGSLGAIYEVSALARPYASLSRAFRAGEMRERFESSPRADGYYYLGNPQIRPEIATQFEIGLKGSDADLSYTLAAYRTRISDFITGLDVSGAPGTNRCPPPNAGACKETVNLGRATLTGFEAQARWQIVRGQWLTGAYSTVRGKNEDLNEPLFQMPADELSLGWEGAVATGWTADALVRLVRRQDRVATVFARGTENATPGFATADFGATWHGKKQRVRVALKNAFDKRYHEHLTDGVSGQEISAPGRSLVLSWQGEF